MFDIPISKMNDKQLRNAVQLLYDELAIFKRKYEDAIHNLDSDNLGKSFTIEQDKMKTQIKITAEKISTKLSKTDLESELSQYSILSQTADTIKAVVSTEYVDSLLGGAYVTNSVFEQKSDEIELSVSELENDISRKILNMSLTADGITTRVKDLENFKTSTFIQNGEGFVLDGEKTKFTGVIYLTNNNKENVFSIFYDESQGTKQVLMHNVTADKMPLVLGDEGSVYIGTATTGNEIATQEWVKSNTGSGGTAYAVFG